MIPLRISLEGFMTYRDRQIFNFDGASLWVLAGPNGAGKSSVFDGITLALYNCHRAGKQNAKALINHSADRLIVEFDFRVGEGLYRVRRVVPRKGSSVRQAFQLQPERSAGAVPIGETHYEKGFEAWVESTIGLKYKTFISSVLLLQGQSTKLLDSSTDERYQMLEEFVNLAPYKRLYELADDKRKQLAGNLKNLEKQLQHCQSIADEDLVKSEAALEQVNDQWEGAKRTVDELTAILEQSKHWRLRCNELDKHEKELTQLKQLLERSDEIQEKYDRYQALKIVLPQLKAIFESRTRIDSDKERIAQVTQELQDLESDLKKAEEQHRTHQEERSRLEQKFQELIKEQTTTANRLAEIAPQLAQVSQIEEAERELEALIKKLEEYPEDLSTQIEQAEVEENALLEAKQSLSPLKQLNSARLKLSTALQTGRQTSDELQSLELKLGELKAEEENTANTLTQAQQAETDSLSLLSYAQKTYDDLCQKLKRFETAVQQPTCELCGQEITPEHAQRERQVLDEHVHQAKSGLDRLKIELQQAQQTKQEIAMRQSQQNQEITQLSQDKRLQEQQLGQLRDEFKYNAGQFREMYDDLPSVYQQRVAPELSGDFNDWLTTTYPTEQDLNEVEKLAQQIPTCSQKLKNLRKQLGERNQLETTRQQTIDRSSRIKEALCLEDLTKLRPEQTRLQQRKKELEQDLSSIISAQEDSKKESDKLDTQLRSQNHVLQQQRVELETTKTRKSEVERTLAVALNALPDVWQHQVQALSAAYLETLMQEQNVLHEYDALRQQLDLAAHSIQVKEHQISSLKAEILEMPSKAQRPTEDIEIELGAEKERRERLQLQRDQSRQAYEKMKEELLRQAQLWQEQMDTEYQHKLHKQLSNLLGPNFLQSHLLRQAETTIVELANEILDGLSRGRLRLELQSEGAESSESKALDLIVYDTETGNSKTAIALTSGSQRFRIAVSLALAIGRYAGQESRCVESVIIDEGFGGLDKNGRDDMIHHLSAGLVY